MADREFAARIQDRYPEGLTAIMAIGGTRITYILEHNRVEHDPGRIDMARYGSAMNDRMQTLIADYFDLGGQNLIIPVLSYQLFEASRGQEYAEQAAKITLNLVQAQWSDFYRAQNIDPYFAGIDTLLRFPERAESYEVGAACARFNREWPYQAGRRKLIWEIAPIPLFSLWRAHEVMGDEARRQFEAELDAAPNMQALHDTLYRYHARALYGTDIPMPHLYLGNNRNGDLKLRAMLPIALECGSPMRLFFTPYPTMFMTRETLQAILEDLAFGKRLRSSKTDYAEQLSPELVAAEYERVRQLSADPNSTVGLTRPVSALPAEPADQTSQG